MKLLFLMALYVAIMFVVIGFIGYGIVKLINRANRKNIKK